MFKTIDIFGLKLRKLSTYSQASVIKWSELPILTLPPITLKLPPTNIVGSKSAYSNIVDSIEVVEVLPWVPDTAIEFLYSLIIWPKKAALFIVSLFFSLVAIISGLSSWTAAV